MLIKAGEPQRNTGGRAFIVLLVALVTLMPTYSAFAEIHATPVAEPTPTATSTPTKEAVEPELESDLLTPGNEDELETSPVKSNAIAPMSVNPIGTLQNCTQTPANGDIVADWGLITGWTITPTEINCMLVVSSVGGDDLASQTGVVTRPALRQGFTARIEVSGIPNPAVLSAGSSAESVHFYFGSGSGGDRTAQIKIIASVSTSSMPAEGATVQGIFSACTTVDFGGECDLSTTGEVLVTAQRQNSVLATLEMGRNYLFDCSPLQPVASLERVVESECEVSAPSGLGLVLSPFVISEINTTVMGASGWDINLELPGVTADTTIPGNTEIPESQRPSFTAFNSTFVFKIELQPTSCLADTGASVSVSLSLQRALLLTPLTLGAIQYSPPMLISATFEAPSPTFTALVLNAPEDVIVPYRMNEGHDPEYRELTIRYVVTGCEPWDGYAKMGPFENTSGGSGLVPILDYAKLDTESMEGLPEGVSLVSSDADIGSDSAVHLVSGVGSGRVDLPFDLRYTIPAGTPVGTYTSTITVTFTSDAP